MCNQGINIGYKKQNNILENNISIGYSSSNYKNNITFGYKCGENIYNKNNILIGCNTGQNCNTENIIIGNKNGKFLGKNNVLFGENLCKNNSGNNNTIIGYDICQLDSSNNTIIGYSNASVISGKNNIIIGNNNINSNKTDITNCITLGYYCLRNEDNINYNNVFEIRNKLNFICGNINEKTLDLNSNLLINKIKLSPDETFKITSNYNNIKFNNTLIRRNIFNINNLSYNNVKLVSENYSNYNIQDHETFIIVTSKNNILILPNINNNNGKLYHIKQLNADTCIIKTNNNNLINSKFSYQMKTQNSCITLMPYANNWIILDHYTGDNNTRFNSLI